MSASPRRERRCSFHRMHRKVRRGMRIGYAGERFRCRHDRRECNRAKVGLRVRSVGAFNLVLLGGREGGPGRTAELAIVRSALRLLLRMLLLLLVQPKRVIPPVCSAQSGEFALKLYLTSLLYPCRHLIK
jgi:hypothetical protein